MSELIFSSDFIKDKIDIDKNSLFFDDENGGLLIDFENFLDEQQKYFDYNNVSLFPERYWNESISKEIFFFMDKIKNNIYPEESFVYEKSDGTIDRTYLNNEINFNTKYSINFIDVFNSDAGYNFCKESDIYEYEERPIIYIGFLYTKINDTVRETQWEVDKNRIIIDDIFLDRFFTTETKEEIKEYFGSNFEEKLIEDFYEEDGGISQGELFEKLKVFDIINNNGILIKDEYENFVSPEFIRSYRNSDPNLLFYGIYENRTLLLKRVINPWVSPWYNKDGKTYSLVRGEDKKVSVLNNKENLDFTKEQRQNGHNRLIMPRYKRKVEIEDLNRNFWVIGQTIAAITSFLFNSSSPISKMLSGLIGEVIQLWDNIAFLNAFLEIENKKNYTPPIHKEVVYLSINELKDYMKYDDFDFNFSSIENFDDVEIELNNGTQLKRKKQNIAFENAVGEYLSNYAQIYKEKFDIVLIPIIRLGNYKNGHFSRIIIPGEYTYSQNYQNFADEDVDCFIDLQAAGRREEKIFFIKNSVLCSQGAEWKASSNLDFNESFILYTEQKNIAGQLINYYQWDINLSDFSEYIYGICENEAEDGFVGCQCLQQANLFQIKNNKPFYGICNLFFNLPTISYDRGRWRCFPTIRIVDLARQIFNYPNSFNTDPEIDCQTIDEDGNNFGDIEPKYNIIAQFTKFTSEIDIYICLNDENKKTGIKDPKQLFLTGALGYYLNELLSTPRQSLNYKYEIFTFDQQQLRPSNFASIDYLKYYREEAIPESEDIKNKINADKAYDRLALRNFLNMFLNYYNVKKTSKEQEVFWTNLVDIDQNVLNVRELFENKSFRIGYDSNLAEQNSTRQNLMEGINNSNKIWDSINEWKEETNNYFDNLCNKYSRVIKNLNDTTILFVSGQRSFQARATQENDTKAINAIADDGLLVKNWKTYSTDVSTIGAAIRIPVGQGETSSFTYYPKHVRALTREETSEKGKGFSYSSSFVPRQEKIYEELNRKCPYFYIWDENLQDYILINDLNDERMKNVYSLPLIQKNIDNNGRERIRQTYSLSSSNAGSGNSQIQILKEREDEEITLTNWLVLKTDIGWAANCPIAIWNEENGGIGQFDGNTIFSSFTNFENKVSNVSSFSDYYYHMILNRRYLRKIFEDKEGYEYDQNYCLNNLIYNSNSPYYLGMEYWIFGWAKIYEKDNDNFSLVGNEFLCDGFNCLQIIDEEIREKLLSLSQNTFQNYSNDDLEELISLLHIVSPQWDSPIIDNEKKYFILGKFYSNRDIDNKELWFEDQVILRNETYSSFKEQELLYNLQGQDQEVWQEKLSSLLVDFNKLDINNLYEIRNWIFPLEEKVNNYFNFEENSSWKIIFDKLNLNDRVYFSNNIITSVEYYLFGPEKTYTDENENEYQATVYAKRGIIRYGTEAVAQLQGYWPRFATQGYWYDFYDPNEGKSIDELREGYEVIQVDDPRNRNFELFKSNYNIGINFDGSYNRDDLDDTRQNKDYIPLNW